MVLKSVLHLKQVNWLFCSLRTVFIFIYFQNSYKVYIHLQGKKMEGKQKTHGVVLLAVQAHCFVSTCKNNSKGKLFRVFVCLGFVLFLNYMPRKVISLTSTVLTACCKFRIPVVGKFLPSFYTSATEDYFGKKRCGRRSCKEKRTVFSRKNGVWNRLKKIGNPSDCFQNKRHKEKN